MRPGLPDMVDSDSFFLYTDNRQRMKKTGRIMEKTMNTCLYNSPIGILEISENNSKIISLYPHQDENVTGDGNSLLQKWQGRQNQHDSQNRQCQQEWQGRGQCSQGQYSHRQDSDLLTEACRQLDEYFQGKRKSFNLPIGYAGTPFQESVWKELQNIPYGETRSYEDIAVKLGNPKAVRAVGQANNRNRILLIIPCHRVIHKNGDVSGFACGIEIKKYLLNFERTSYRIGNYLEFPHEIMSSRSESCN